MVTDMVGYTALSQANESLAMELLESHRSLIRPPLRESAGGPPDEVGNADVRAKVAADRLKLTTIAAVSS